LATLAFGPVHPRHHGQILQLRYASLGLAERTERVEALRARPLRLQFLEITSGHIIGSDDRADCAGCVPFACAAEPTTDDDSDLSFVLHLLRLRREADR